MTVSAERQLRFSILALEDQDPYYAYRQMLEEADISWDEGLQAWVAWSYAACQSIFRADKAQFSHPDADVASDYKTVSQGRRHPKTLDADEHTRLHQWLAQRFSPRQTASLREGVIRRIIGEVVDGFSSRGCADLASDFADHIPIRVIASVMELPCDDPDWVSQIKAALDQIGVFYNKRLAGDDELTRRTKAAFETIRHLLDPTIEARRAGAGDDIVSQMWRDGPALLDDWDAEDIYINITSVFIGGYDTTTMAISNACKLLLDDPALLANTRDADDAKLRRFVDESLRLLPPVQYRARRARCDVEIAGRTIRAGELVVPLIGSANRDGVRYSCPATVDLTRRQSADHLTFITGPRTCIGAGLARSEVAEALRLLLDRLPDIRWDPSAPLPVYGGLVLRRYSPLNVIFTARR